MVAKNNPDEIVIFLLSLNFELTSKSLPHTSGSVLILRKSNGTIFPISYYDLYTRNTLRVMSELSDFLGVSHPKIKLIMNLFKYTKVQKIPNIDEILDVFKRSTLDELEYWCPNEF